MQNIDIRPKNECFTVTGGGGSSLHVKSGDFREETRVIIFRVEMGWGMDIHE